MEKVATLLPNNTKEKLQKELEQSYKEALKNSTFKELITALALEKEEVMKYTSTIEECANEFEHCKTCQNILMCPNKIKGFALLPTTKDGLLTFEYQACKYKRKLENKLKYQKYMTAFDVPNDLLNASIKEIDTKDKNRYPTIKWIQKFLVSYFENPKQKGLYLYGNFGAGKSYLIVAMFAELAKKQVRSAIVFWPEFLRSLKSSFGSDFKEKYETVKKVELLLIDDIGAEITTEWGRDEIFCPLIQYRMDANLPTFFTSNLDLKLLEEHFSCSKKGTDVVKARRIISRIEQLTDQIELLSQNRRK